ncbi:hypothetical protein RCL1_002399 [Eukaryota sp. TZLM3-RCL]
MIYSEYDVLNYFIGNILLANLMEDPQHHHLWPPFEISTNDYLSLCCSTSDFSCTIPPLLLPILTHSAQYLRTNGVFDPALGSRCLNLFLSVVFSGLLNPQHIASFINKQLPCLAGQTDAAKLTLDLLLNGPLLFPSLFAHCFAIPRPVHKTYHQQFTPIPPQLHPLATCSDPPPAPSTRPKSVNKSKK